MGVSAGHPSPENQPPHGGHSEPWGWGRSGSPLGSLSSPRQECFHVLEVEGLGWEKESGTVVEPRPPGFEAPELPGPPTPVSVPCPERDTSQGMDRPSGSREQLGFILFVRERARSSRVNCKSLSKVWSQGGRKRPSLLSSGRTVLSPAGEIPGTLGGVGGAARTRAPSLACVLTRSVGLGQGRGSPQPSAACAPSSRVHFPGPVSGLLSRPFLLAWGVEGGLP